MITIAPLGKNFNNAPKTASLPEEIRPLAARSEPKAGRSRSWLFFVLLTLLFWSVLIGGLVFTRLYNYLLFHTLVELFSIVVACSIFMIAWNARKFMDNNYFLFVGIASLFVGIIGIFHTLAYEGMGVFAGYETNLATQLWVSARYTQSISLVLAPFFLNRKLRSRLVFGVYALFSAILLSSIFFWKIFPDCFIEGLGLTPFKIVSEYLISALFVSAAFLLLWRKEKFDRNILYLLIASILSMVFAEQAFTMYESPYGPSNFAGHLLMVFSFYFLYRALINTGLRKPYNLLFRNLKQSEEALRDSESQYRRLSESLEQKVDEKVAELRLAQRLAAIGEMVSVVAHEIRNPLQNIGMGIEAIRTGIGNTRENVEILEEIDYGVASLSAIVSELLDYSRPTSLNLTASPVGALVRRALSTGGEKLRNVDLVVQLEAEDRHVWVDESKIVRVLVNLLSNAVEAMSGPGAVQIQSRFCFRDSKEWLLLTISDSGSGIHERDAERIFEPFYTTKARGTGLGLAICKKIIEAHKGSIRIQSEIQKGTTIEILLPIA